MTRLASFALAAACAVLSLPAAAPLVSTYSASLPLNFAAAPAASGQYRLEADAASGATQSTSVNATTNQSNVDLSF